MKKLLTLLIVLAMTSVATAAMIDVVLDEWIDENENGIVDESDIIKIKIVTNVTLDGYDLDLHVSGPGTLGEHNGGPAANHMMDDMGGFFWGYSGIANNAIARMTDGWLSGLSAIGDLVWGLQIHCEGPGPVLVDLTLGVEDSRAQIEGEPHVLTDDDLGDLVIEQVPEPMTIALLGLGGLFLRRRK